MVEIRLRVLIGCGSGQLRPPGQTSSWDTDLNYPVADDDDRLTQILEAAHLARRDIMLATQVGAWLVNAEYDARTVARLRAALEMLAHLNLGNALVGYRVSDLLFGILGAVHE